MAEPIAEGAMEVRPVMDRVHLVDAHAVELVADKTSRANFDPKQGVGAYCANRAQANGLILRAMAGDAIAFSPPLIISEAEIDEMVARFTRALDETAAWLGEAAA